MAGYSRVNFHSCLQASTNPKRIFPGIVEEENTTAIKKEVSVRGAVDLLTGEERAQITGHGQMIVTNEKKKKEKMMTHQQERK